MDRNERQLKIIETVKTHAVETQEDLVLLLREQGYSVTQATISRDIKELGLIKVNSEGRYRYAVVSSSPQNINISPAMLSLYREVVQKVTVSLNLVVLSTRSGNATAIAAMLDTIHLPKVLGTVGGDDTIILVAESVIAAPEIADQLNKMLK